MMEEPITNPQFEPTSAEKVSENEDLATEIFIHMSATSLAPCLRVSKLWLSFISNQTFVSRHTFLYPPSLSGLFLIPRQTAQHPEIHFLSLNQREFKILPFVSFLNSEGFQIIHSCNGLLLCRLELSHYVCNPSTCRLRVLPSCSMCSYMENEYTLELAFDPLTSPDYKVVCLQKLDSQQSLYQIAIYSSETRLWSLTQEPVFASNGLEFKDGVFCNGAIHWLTSTSTGAYLDLKTELLREMPQPPRREEESQYKFKYFGKSKAMARNFGRHPYLFSELECDVMCINHVGSNDDMEIVLSVPDHQGAYRVQFRI
ncbi:F-box protein At5g07610 isoform X4 [Spinacia oleracea]|uniref:F-box protein At5g07610 isoform X4 n=1 Tax=Spinacia oleracea TaxID=3562 RepID=A0ABM3QWM3_SPIOL|nr:F-box protein At5g07610-like isoform X4 [Spinacia oleracea]